VVQLQPEPLGTLEPGDEAGFGPAHGGRVCVEARGKIVQAVREAIRAPLRSDSA
jgi:hypothetical protein